MKILIDNRTDLNNEIVGKMIDDIIKNGIIDTLYYGKCKLYEIGYCNNIYHIETQVMKRYFKVFIECKGERVNG